jgi:hypothetical protein
LIGAHTPPIFEDFVQHPWEESGGVMVVEKQVSKRQVQKPSTHSNHPRPQKIYIRDKPRMYSGYVHILGRTGHGIFKRNDLLVR